MLLTGPAVMSSEATCTREGLMLMCVRVCCAETWSRDSLSSHMLFPLDKPRNGLFFFFLPSPLASPDVMTVVLERVCARPPPSESGRANRYLMEPPAPLPG